MQTVVAMWRSVRWDDFPNGPIIDGKAVTGVLYPDFERKHITSGKKKGTYRRADIMPVMSGGIMFVEPTGGTSLFDKINIFGTKYWVCFEIPEGTIIPPSLVIKGPDYNDGFDANHYQIEPKTRMLLEHFKADLDILARNAIARKVALSGVPK